MAQNLARKLTLKNIGLDMKTVKGAVANIADGTTVAIGRFWGIATEGRAGSTDKGPYLVLIGDFEAVNLVQDRKFKSSRCILPAFVSDSFHVVLKEYGKVEFAIEIGATRRDDAITGYEYVAQPLMEAQASDRMKELSAFALEGAPESLALAAPEVAPKAAKKAAKKAKR